MKRPQCPPNGILHALGQFICAIIFIAFAPVALAAPASLKLNENYGESLKCAAATNRCKIVKRDEFTATFSIPLTSEQAGAIAKSTVIGVQLGELRFDQKLGKKFNPKTRTATITTNAKNSVGKMAGSRTMEVSVTDEMLVCKITSKVSDVDGAKWKPIVVSTSLLRRARTSNISVPAAIQLGKDRFDFTVKGKARVRNDSAKGTDGKNYKLSKLVFNGSGKLDVNRGPLPVVVTTGTDSPAGDATIGSQGGSINCSGALAGVTINVPAGAMNGDTPIIVSSNDIQINPRSGTFSGTAVNIHTGPQNVFTEPLAVTIPMNGGPPGSVPVPYYIDNNGILTPCQVTSIDRENGTMTFETFHASLFSWIWALFFPDVNLGGHTAYFPRDGFQIVNYGSPVNPGGECFGISAFAQWLYANKGGGLFPKYMTDIPTGVGTTKVKGQNIIATRAHTSVSRLWTSYLPNLGTTSKLTGPEVYQAITNILDNTARPTMLYLNESSTGGPHAAHAVLAYDHVGTNQLRINDPNYPGEARTGYLKNGKLTYGDYAKVSVIGNGSFTTENLLNIFEDAETGFNGTALAQVNITSHANGQRVTDRIMNLTGKVKSGSVLVDKIAVWLNGTTKFERTIGPNGQFSVPITLGVGENKLSFETSGTNVEGNRINVLTTQTSYFIVHLNSARAQVLVTLSWETDLTDLDLYVIDPTGDFSSWNHRLTADGGELDRDELNGFGPEHWTLSSTDTVRWNEPYKVRVHYVSDNNPDPPTISSRWEVNVVLYEGTARAQSYSITDVLSHDDDSNVEYNNSGDDWADVVDIVPQRAAAGAPAIPTFETNAKGVPRLIIPIPGEAEVIRLNENPPPRR